MKSLTHSLLAGALPLVLLTACGGGDDSSTPETGAAIPGTPEGTLTITASNVISGRVADGYIQGATVCVDVNENGACDADEPSALTGTGGSYELAVPSEETEKPIIASVPATAIDEDTGEAIGKKLVLSTPHDRPEFISPITTLVHEELKGNPTLSTGDAEATVREELGLGSDSRASLFTDYVANQSGQNSEDAEHYRFLHQAARVVASMMDDIQGRVELVATNGGLDFAGDTIAQEAIRKLVRQEVRDLLPEISRAVADTINAQQEQSEGSAPVSIVDEVDPNKVVDSLRPTDLETDVIDKIEAIRGESEVRKVAMEKLLKDGIYWIDVDCEDRQHYCYADYGHISVTGEDNIFTEEQYEFDKTTGSWEKWEELDEADHFAFVLKDGEWAAVNGDDAQGSVEFLADGGALLTTERGKMVVYASANDLADKPVVHHLRQRHAPSTLLESVDESALFPADSVAHRIHIKRQSEAHVLFNWAGDDFDDNSQQCAEFGGNCNVLETIDASGIAPIVSLNDVLDGSAEGIEIAAVSQHQFVNRALNVKLTADATTEAETDKVVAREANIVFPMQGVATWFIEDAGTDSTYPAPGECGPSVEFPKEEYPQVDLPIDEPLVVEFPVVDMPVDDNAPEQQGSVQFRPAQAESPCEYPTTLPPELCIGEVEQQFPDKCHDTNQALADDAAAAVIDESTEAPGADKVGVFASSRWKTITVQGVTMIQIGLPVAVKQSVDIEEASSMLLIEHEGYVRRGAKLGDAGVTDELTYSLPALETLKAIIETYITSTTEK